MREYNKNESAPFELVMADPVEFFEKYEKENELPVVSEELQHHASGCYSAVSEVKTLLRKGEAKMTEAERFSVLAKLTVGKEYSRERIADLLAVIFGRAF